MSAKNTSGKPSHDISHPVEVTSHCCSPLSPGMHNLFPPSGTPFFLFHPPRSWNESDVPLVRGKNSPPWRVRGATRKANCLNEIPVRDEWEVRLLLGSQACAAAGLCPVKTLKATVLCLFSVVCFMICQVLGGNFRSRRLQSHSGKCCALIKFLGGHFCVLYCLPTI